MGRRRMVGVAMLVASAIVWAGCRDAGERTSHPGPRDDALTEWERSPWMPEGDPDAHPLPATRIDGWPAEQDRELTAFVPAFDLPEGEAGVLKRMTHPLGAGEIGFGGILPAVYAGTPSPEALIDFDGLQRWLQGDEADVSLDLDPPVRVALFERLPVYELGDGAAKLRGNLYLRDGIEVSRASAQWWYVDGDTRMRVSKGRPGEIEHLDASVTLREGWNTLLFERDGEAVSFRAVGNDELAGLRWQLVPHLR